MLGRRRSIGLLLGVVACTPAPRAPSEAVTSAVRESTQPAVVDVSSIERPATEPADEAPAEGLRGLVQDLAIVLPDGTVVQDSAQCFVGASWAASQSPDDLEPADLAGAKLHLIDAHGVAETTVEQLTATTRLRLATRSRAPWAHARLDDRWLQRRVPDGASIAKWARAAIGKPLKVVGQIRGTFGDGVDRIVVLAPRTLPTMLDDEDAWRVSEVAVLVAGDTPTGLLPFTTTFEGDDEDFEPGIYGLQVAGVVDLDGDGVEEVVWSSHGLSEELTTELHASYFADGEHRVHELSSCTYWGCNVVLPQGRCRGPVKRMD